MRIHFLAAILLATFTATNLPQEGTEELPEHGPTTPFRHHHLNTCRPVVPPLVGANTAVAMLHIFDTSTESTHEVTIHISSDKELKIGFADSALVPLTARTPHRLAVRPDGDSLRAHLNDSATSHLVTFREPIHQDVLFRQPIAEEGTARPELILHEDLTTDVLTAKVPWIEFDFTLEQSHPDPDPVGHTTDR